MINIELKEKLIAEIRKNPDTDYWEKVGIFAVEDTEEEKGKRYQQDRIILDACVEVGDKTYAIFLV